MTRLRLLKVAVQPVFVEDDGEHLTERMAEPFEVSASEWADVVELLERERSTAEAHLNTGPDQ